MDGILKVHMTIIIAVLVFVLGILSFFLVRFVSTVDGIDIKMTTLSENVIVIKNDNEWIKKSLSELLPKK